MAPGQTLPPGRMGGTTGKTTPPGRGSRDQRGAIIVRSSALTSLHNVKSEKTLRPHRSF